MITETEVQNPQCGKVGCRPRRADNVDEIQRQPTGELSLAWGSQSFCCVQAFNWKGLPTLRRAFCFTLGSPTWMLISSKNPLMTHKNNHHTCQYPMGEDSLISIFNTPRGFLKVVLSEKRTQKVISLLHNKSVIRLVTYVYMHKYIWLITIISQWNLNPYNYLISYCHVKHAI